MDRQITLPHIHIMLTLYLIRYHDTKHYSWQVNKQKTCLISPTCKNKETIKIKNIKNYIIKIIMIKI